MAKAIIAAILAILVYVCPVSAQDRKTPNEFITHLNKVIGVIEAHREMDTIWMIVAPMPNESEANFIACMTAARFKRETGQSICVRVHDGTQRTLGRSCEY